MFAIGPPAEVVSALEIVVRTLKERDVRRQKVVGLRVRDVGVTFFVVRVETLDVGLEFVGAEDGDGGFGLQGLGEWKCQGEC